MEKRKTTQAKEESPDIPDSIKRFRSAIRHVKENIINKSELYDNDNDDEDIQDLRNLSPMLKRIHQFGTFIVMILDDKNNLTIAAIRDVYEHFLRNSVDLTKLTDEEAALCRHYVDNDIRRYPYSPRPGHINSQRR
jgi:hypothetical protein